MSAFEVVTLIVAVIAIVVAVITYFRLNSVLQELGRGGRVWFDHSADQNIADRPVEDDRDDPIPRRRLRGRPE